MPKQRFYIYNGDLIGDGPATKKFNVVWLGDLRSADLILLFGGKFGWELLYAELNGKRLNPTKTNEISASNIGSYLINGENTLVVVYNYIPFNQTAITAYIDIDSDFGTVQWPNIAQFFQDIAAKLKAATLPTLLLIGLIAAIVIAIAYITARFAGAKKALAFAEGGII